MIDASLLPKNFQGKRLEEVLRFLDGFRNPRQLAVRLSRVLRDDESLQWADRFLFEGDSPLPLFSSLCRTLAQSEFLTSILERDPSLLISFQSDDDFARSSGPAVFERELHRHLGQLTEGESYQVGLARFKLHEIFRVAVRDITGRAQIETLARELSELADFVLQAAYQKIYLETVLSLGIPRLEDGRLAEMAVISLGKHGSHELNFSSDLDLILLYEGEGKTALEGYGPVCDSWLEEQPFARYQTNLVPKARTRGVDFEVFFTELGTRLIETVSEPGPLGSVYRIDMRLRPEGESGPLVRNLESALLYYENWGENWERQALLRARFCAGRQELADLFLEAVSDFIFRKYVDPVEVEETLRGIRELRIRSIHQSGGHDEERRRNVKNGPGGIRDIEFLVQAVQILYGGQFPELRDGSVFELLRRIHQSGLISASDYEVLSSGYSFLRRLEHRVQMDDLQKYHVPSEPTALETLAFGMSFANGKSLEREMFETMGQIHTIFREVFRLEDSEKPIDAILEQKELSEDWRATIAGHHLSDPDAVFRSLSRLSVDRDSPHLNSKLRRLLKSILPRLFSLVRDTPSPDLAWKVFENVSLATPARSTFFSMIEENPRLLDLLVNLGSASPYLAEMLQANPRLIDDLVDRLTFETSFHADRLESDYEEQEGARDFGETLPHVRSFRRRAEMHIAGRFVLGLSEIEEAVSELSELAGFCLAKCIDETWRLGSLGMAIFGLGKLGGRELGFRSDLDLMVFYDPRLQPNSELPARLAANLVNELGAYSPEGRLFEADLRLRPHGKSAPLTTSFEAALEYYREEGQTWERLALTRCRPVWGEGVVIQEMQDRLHDWVFANPADEEVLEEIRQMRHRIERDKPKETLKTGPGGLLDVEFIAQAGQLRWGVEDPSIRSPNTCQAIANFVTRGRMKRSTERAIREAYLFLREIENRLSLLGKSGSHGLPSEPAALEHLVGCLNLAKQHKESVVSCEKWSPESLVKTESEMRSRVREIFDSLFSEGFRR